MAKMRMANMTNKPICISGAKAFRIDLSTTWRPERKKRRKGFHLAPKAKEQDKYLSGMCGWVADDDR